MQIDLFGSGHSIPTMRLVTPADTALQRAEFFEKCYKRNVTTQELASLYRLIAELASQKVNS